MIVSRDPVTTESPQPASISSYTMDLETAYTYYSSLPTMPTATGSSYGGSAVALAAMESEGTAVGSVEYRSYLFNSYTAAMAACGPGQVVCWSSTKGYYVGTL